VVDLGVGVLVRLAALHDGSPDMEFVVVGTQREALPLVDL
jgi:hypothetical protein